MEFRLYFDLLTSGPKAWTFVVQPSVFLLIGIVAVFVLLKYRGVLRPRLKYPKFVTVFMYLWTGFAFLFTLASCITVFGEYVNLRNALVDSKYEEVEGVVTNFHPMPFTGHQEETFTVNDVSFAYSDYLVTNAFNNTKSHGGPIDQDKYVRIDYFEGKILRLWIRE